MIVSDDFSERVSLSVNDDRVDGYRIHERKEVDDIYIFFNLW